MRLIADKYEVITELGVGGTGSVLLVRHTDLGVHYALKLLNRDLSEDRRFIETFKQEAEVLLHFSHPGTTQLRDFGRTEDDLYYLAMDYCDGLPLKDVLEKDGPYPVKRGIEICIQILSVLEAAHIKGIIHRDIKPANIMIERDAAGVEQVRVLDFGTALLKKHMGESAEVVAVGTPCYMSPEQAAGDGQLDHRSDIYAVGIVLYELLTGDVPYEGESIIQTLIMHLTQPPAPFAARYGIPHEVEGLVFRALSKKKEDRFESAAEFSKSCQAVLDKIKKDLTPSGAIDLNKKESKEIVAPQQSEKEQLKILCLDDNEMILHILQHILEKEGYKVFTALDCSSIHSFLFQEKIDLLVSDVQMPGMPGTKICKLLKKTMQELKVVLFSNIPERELKKCSEENLADGWISKHTKPDEWLAKIKEIIEPAGV